MADESWRDKSVIQRNLHLLNSGLIADCTFVVGATEKKKMRCHKFILSQGSQVFNAMFNGDLREKGDVTVEDIEPENFWKMLEFIYSDSTELENVETALSVCYAANKYMINTLTLKCIDFIKKNLDTDIVIRTLEFARLIDNDELEAQSLQYLNSNNSAVLKSASFRYAERATLLAILSQDTCDASEVEIFSACVRWAKTQQRGPTDKLRDALGPDVLSLIRFLTMTAQEFATVVIPSKILQLQEEQDILCRLVTGTGNMPRGFNTNMETRAVVTGPKEIVEIQTNYTNTSVFGSTYTNTPVFGSANVTSQRSTNGQLINTSPFTFSVNVECFIYGLQLGGLSSDSVGGLSRGSVGGFSFGCSESIHSIEDRLEVILLQGSDFLTSAVYKGLMSVGKTVEVNFSKPFLLKANTNYTLQMKYSNLQTIYSITQLFQSVYQTNTGVRMNVSFSHTTISQIYIAKKKIQ